MGVKISDLPSNSQVALTDVFPENHDGTTYKATLSDVKDLFDIPEVDDTLEVSGAAADAKATGDRIRALETAFDSKAPVIINSASGDVATISDGADDMAMTSVAVNIAPMQSGTGDPSPDNVRPISGWTAVNVTRAGKNLLPSNGEASRIAGGITFTKNLDGSVSASGTATANTTYRIVTATDGYTLKKGTYIITGFTKTSGLSYVWKISDGASGYWYGTSDTITLTDDTTYEYIAFRVASGTTVNMTVYPMIRPASITDATYEPYTAQTYPVTLPTEAGTVYGGVLDVTKGTLTVDVAYKSFNSADMNNSENYPGWKNAGIADLGYAGVTSGLNVMCSVGSWIAYNTSSDVIYMPRAKYSNMTQTEWIALGVDVQMLIPLLTPITYTLTPTEIRTLLGVNNVWADAGAVNVEYPADTKLYIDGKIAELQALVLENNG